MKSKLFYTQLFGLLSLLVILLVTIPIYTDKIPKELKKEVWQKLKKNGLNWVAIRVEGRDITLSGIAPSIPLHNKAINIVKHSLGVRLVHDKISPTVITPYSMTIKYKQKEKKLIFNGYMPSKKSIENLFVEVIKNYPSFKIVKQIDVGAGEPKEWKSLILVVSLLMKKLDLGVVHIIDKEVVFSGKCQTSQQESEILLYLKEYKNIGFTIKSRVVAMDEATKICQKRFKELLSTNRIEFRAGKSIVKSSSEALLQELVDISALCPNVKLKIIGHTDSRGDNLKNKELSESRAKAVVAKLFQLGIPLEQMIAIGKGESEPLVSNETKEGRAKNRRIEFKVIGE